MLQAILTTSAPADAQAPTDAANKKPRRIPRDDHLFDQFSPWNTEPVALVPRHWLYGRHYLRGALTLTIAPPGLGKSTLAITEAVAMATGRNLLGEPVARPLNVYYYNGEETVAEIMRHVFAACQHFGIDPRELKCRLRIESGVDGPGEGIFITTKSEEGGGIIIDADEIKRLRAMLTGWAIDVLIIDPFVCCHGVGENDNSAIDMVARALSRLASRTTAAIELIHHTRKHGSGETAVADARGASSLLAAARSVRVLNQLSQIEAARPGVKDRRAFFKIERGKANYAASGNASWFQLVPVELSNGDSVATVAPWHRPDAFDGIEASHRERIRAMAKAADYRGDPRSEQWIGRAIADVVGLDPEADGRRIKAIIKGWLADGTLVEIEAKDASRHKRLYIKPGEQNGSNAAGVESASVPSRTGA